MHRQLLLLRFSGFVIAGVVFTSVLYAQFGAENIADQDIGLPPQAPFITFLGTVTPGKMATDPSLPLSGPVAEALYEELRAQKTPAGPAGEVVTSIRTKYDEAGRTTEETRKQWGTETTTINRYEGTRLVSQETTFPNIKKPRPKSWNYWVYDQSGKLTEYRRGSGDEIQNHYANFKRDGQGRLTSFEYRQGAKDEFFSRTEFRYSPDGKTIDSTFYDATGDVTRSTTQSVDDQGHVVWVAICERDWKTKKPKAPLKVAFRYDAQGRLLEQNTGAHEFEAAGSEHELPPGRISIAYDDVKHTKTTAYAGYEGLLTSTVTYNASGATIAVAGGTGDRNVDAELECTYDSHENWTTCQLIDKHTGVGTVAKRWRRTIAYR